MRPAELCCMHADTGFSLCRSPHFGIGHAMCLGLAPWLAAEIPHLVDSGVISAAA